MTQIQWWEEGVLLDTLIQYWQMTDDDQYNDMVTTSLQANTGEENDFQPLENAFEETNEDQGAWALAAMSAAESHLPLTSGPSWVQLAQTVFNEQALRWDKATCSGGLRWQIYPTAVGYEYKFSLTNGEFFQLAARLARYTGNSTYSDWASKVYDWTTSSGFIDDAFNVYEGANIIRNCSSIIKRQDANSAGAYISGLAYMYNTTDGNAEWQAALKDVLARTLTFFFPDGIATEKCELKGMCSGIMHYSKGTLGRWLIDAVKLAPFTSEDIFSKLSSTAKAAAKACTVGSNGKSCPYSWGSEEGDHSTTSLGSELSAMTYIQGLLVHQAASPATATGVGTSTAPGGSTISSSTTGAPSPSSSDSAGVAIGTGHAGVGVLAGMLSLMVCFIL